MTQQEIIVKLFDFFYCRIHQVSSFHLDVLMRNHQTNIDNFLEKLSKRYHLSSLGPTFFKDYFCHAFYYWTSKDTKQTIKLEWVIGDKALKRWKERNEHYVYFYERDLLEKYKITHRMLDDLLIQKLDIRNLTDTISEAEEADKARFPAQARLAMCLELTTLYSHKSSICRTCKSASTCKSLLKKTNNRLYTLRGYK